METSFSQVSLVGIGAREEPQTHLSFTIRKDSKIVKKGTQHVYQVNWGGLANHGGGSKDYMETDLTKDLLLIESVVGEPNTVPWKWKWNTEHILHLADDLRSGRFHRLFLPVE